MICFVLGNCEVYSKVPKDIPEKQFPFCANTRRALYAKRELNKFSYLKRDGRSVKYFKDNFMQRRKHKIKNNSKMFKTMRITTCTPFFKQRPTSKEKSPIKFSGKLGLDWQLKYTDSSPSTMYNITSHPKRRKFINLFFPTKTFNNYSQLMKNDNGSEKNGITTLNGENISFLSGEILNNTDQLHLHIQNTTIPMYNKIENIFNNFANNASTNPMLSIIPITDQYKTNNLVDRSSNTIPLSVKSTKRIKMKFKTTKSKLRMETKTVKDTNNNDICITEIYNFRKPYQNCTATSYNFETGVRHFSVETEINKSKQEKSKNVMKKIFNFNKAINHFNEYNNTKTINYNNITDITTEYYLTIFPSQTRFFKKLDYKNDSNLEEGDQKHLAITIDSEHDLNEYTTESMIHFKNQVDGCKPTQKKKYRNKWNSRKYIYNKFHKKKITKGMNKNVLIHQKEKSSPVLVESGGFETSSLCETAIASITCADSDFVPVTGLQNNMFCTTKSHQIDSFTENNQEYSQSTPDSLRSSQFYASNKMLRNFKSIFHLKKAETEQRDKEISTNNNILNTNLQNSSKKCNNEGPISEEKIYNSTNKKLCVKNMVDQINKPTSSISHRKIETQSLQSNSTVENKSIDINIKNYQTSQSPTKSNGRFNFKNIFHKEKQTENTTESGIVTTLLSKFTTSFIQTQISSSTELDKPKNDSVVDYEEETESFLKCSLDHKTAMHFKDMFKKQSLGPNEFDYSSTTELYNHMKIEKTSITSISKIFEKQHLVNNDKTSVQEQVQNECISCKSNNSPALNGSSGNFSTNHEKIATCPTQPCYTNRLCYTNSCCDQENSTCSNRTTYSSAKEGNKNKSRKYNISNNKSFRKWKFENKKAESKKNVTLSKCKPNHLVVNEEGNLYRWCLNTSPMMLSLSNISTSCISSSSEVTITTNSESSCSNCSVKKHEFKNIFNFFKASKITTGIITSRNLTAVSKNSLTSPISSAATFKETTTLMSKYLVYSKSKNGSISASNLTFANSDQIDSYPKAKTRIYPPMKINKHYKTKKIYSPFEKIVTTNSNDDVIEYETDHFQSFVKNMVHKANSTVLLHPDYLEYMDSKVKSKKVKNSLFRSKMANNTDSSNDTSFHIMAYIKKPLESLISVFRATFSNVTKVGEVNATDVNNGSLTNHFGQPNSSIIILAMNNTRNLTKEMHESKVGLFDMLGGWFHCVLENYSEPRLQDIHFYLYTRNNSNDPEEIIILNEQVSCENDTDYPETVLEKEMPSEFLVRPKRESEDNDFESVSSAKSNLQLKWFNTLSRTKILIHGYIQDYHTDIMVNMKDAYLRKGPYNVILVDWSVIGDNSCYPMVATKALRSVGGLVAQLVDQLVDGGVSPETVHLVGFSLGAHVAGHAGTELTHGLVYRITGLDPALPYIPMDPDVSLDSGDAMFVDIIHSAAGYLGQPGPMGHVDFYPNGGSQQPGCDLTTLGACSHRRSALYFIESINTEDGFIAVKCDSWHDFQAGHCNHSTSLPMGEACPNNASGKYFLVTGQKEPFTQLSEEHIKVKKSLWQDFLYEIV